MQMETEFDRLWLCIKEDNFTLYPDSPHFPTFATLNILPIVQVKI